MAANIKRDAPPQSGGGFTEITLAYHVDYVEQMKDVEKVIALAKSVGANIVIEPQEVFWGSQFQFDKNGMLLF